MKNTLISLFLFAALPFSSHLENKTKIDPRLITGNVFIITTDGFRWQEVFTGADSSLVNNENYTPDTATVKALYWAPDATERRKKLMPFFWSVINAKGQIYGNRDVGSKSYVTNGMNFSYPGYNETLCGFPDPMANSCTPGFGSAIRK